MADVLEATWNALKSVLSNELVIAIIAALVAYLFAIKAQKSVLKEQHKLSVYDAIWKRRDELSSAIIDLSVHVRGLANEYVMLESISNTRNTMRGIADKPDYMYDYDMRKRWGDYCMKISEEGSAVSQGFVKLHSSFEQTFFMYPHLKNAFFLLRDEYELIFNLHQDTVKVLYNADGPALIDKNNQEELLKKVDELKLVEQLIDLQVYLDDYFRWVQHALAGKIFKFTPDERKPRIGKVLSPKGWHHIQTANTNNFDTKMLKQAKKEAAKSKEPIKCGVLLVDKDNQIIAKTYNSQREDNKTANHAEMKAIAAANEKVGRKLQGFTAYCSCEPCPMCLTALMFASVKRIVYAQPLNDLVQDDKKRIYVESYSFINRFPDPPQLDWIEVK